jgi:hypothetical protein
MYSLEAINSLVLRKQHLTEDSPGDGVLQVAADIGGLHATSTTTPYLSLYSRLKGFTRESLDVELNEKRLAKIRCMRGTMHMLPASAYMETVSALRRTLELKPYHYKQYLGMSSGEYDDMSKSILEIVKSDGMTAPEAKKALGSSVNISRVMGVMCDQSLLARGMPRSGWTSNVYTYYQFSEYFHDMALEEIPEQAAMRSLIRRYLAAFGPATNNDIAWWTGLSKKSVKEALSGLRQEIIETNINGPGGDFFMLREDERRLRTVKPLRELTVRLLPVLDPYTMGYKDRDRFLDRAYYSSVYDTSGNGTSAILVNGRITGVWDFAREPEPAVLLCPFDEFPKDALSEIYAKARSTGRFLVGKDCRVEEADHLSRKIAWSFTSPLKSAY